MTHHKVIAEDSLSAMDEISKVLGKDAVILETKKVNGKIEITGSNNIADIAKCNAKRKISEPKANFTNLFTNYSLEESLKAKQVKTIVKEIEIDTNIINKDSKYVNHATFSTFTNKIEKMLENMILTDIDSIYSKNLKSSTLDLLKKGYSREIISEFSDAIENDKKIDPELVFFHCLAKRLVFSFEERVLNSNIIFINGSSGCGKTTLSSKVASYILDNKFVGNQRNKLSIIDFSPKSSNNLELVNFGRLLNLNVTSISNLDELQKFINANKNDRTLIVDVSKEILATNGYEEYLTELSEKESFSNILAIPSGTNKNSIKSQIEFYRKSNPVIALTKLDEAYVGAEELSVFGELKCKIGLLSGSKSLIGSLAFAKQEVMAQYMKDMD